VGLENIGVGEVAVILLLALFVFGPERLPGMAAEAGKALRKARTFVKGMSEDIKTELGPEFGDVDLASLNPKTFVTKHLLSDDDDDEYAPATRRARAGAPLAADEPAPWDPDTT